MSGNRDTASSDDSSAGSGDAAGGYFAEGRFGTSIPETRDNLAYAFAELNISLRAALGQAASRNGATGLTAQQEDEVVKALKIDAVSGAWSFDLPTGVIEDHLASGLILDLRAQVRVSASENTGAEFTGLQPFQLQVSEAGVDPVLIPVYGADETNEAASLIAAGRISLPPLHIGDPLEVQVQPQDTDYVGTFTVPDDNLHCAVDRVGTIASLTWNFVVAENEIETLPDAGEQLQAYDLLLSDRAGEMAVHTVIISLTGPLNAPLSQRVAKLELSPTV